MYILPEHMYVYHNMSSTRRIQTRILDTLNLELHPNNLSWRVDMLHNFKNNDPRNRHAESSGLWQMSKGSIMDWSFQQTVLAQLDICVLRKHARRKVNVFHKN